jgi:hypothetical protein
MYAKVRNFGKYCNFFEVENLRKIITLSKRENDFWKGNYMVVNLIFCAVMVTKT